MSKTNLSVGNTHLIWTISAGRCQYRGCNEILYRDMLTQRNFNGAYIAHIVADEPKGPRGDVVRSKLLANDISNLMLLCDKHHRLVDKEDVTGHTEAVLLEMKREHEVRIERVTGISASMRSHIITYRANVGRYRARELSFQTVSSSLLPEHYPASAEVIDLSIVNSPYEDKEDQFWEVEATNLDRQFSRKIQDYLAKGEINHFSLFAFAPIPLLIKFGSLINSSYQAEIYQPRRYSSSLKLNEGISTVSYVITRPSEKKQNVALCISLSGKIAHERITDILGNDCSIYEIAIPKPDPDYLDKKEDLHDFGKHIRAMLDEIKSKYGEKSYLNIFPAMPISTAILLGRTWLSKADMPMVIYDQNTAKGGFHKALTIMST